MFYRRADTGRPVCANPTCERTRKRGHLACIDCWLALPDGLQRNVTAAAKAFRQRLPGAREAFIAAVRDCKRFWLGEVMHGYTW